MLRELAAKAKTINVHGLALDNAKANSELINELIRQQLTVGENSDGNKIGTYTTSRYAAFKKRIGSLAPLGVPDLKLSGDLFKGLKTVFKQDMFTTESSVSYSKYQEQRYTDKVYRLQEQNAEEIEFKVLNATIKEYVKAMGL